MDSQKLCVKLFLQDPKALHRVKLLPVFQSWIQLRAIEDHLAIDVADYEHVPDGPGTVLVTHEANFSMDAAQGRPGLLYQRKQALAGSFEERVATVFRHELLAAARLEENPGLKFRTDEVLFRVADRLLAPNTAETFEAVRPGLEKVFSRLLGPSIQLEHRPSERTLFEVTIRSTTSATVSDLLAKVEPVRV